MELVASLPGITFAAPTASWAAAVRHATARGWRVNVAVVDRAGHLVAFGRMPGAFIHSVELAIDKAFCAASFGFPTGSWASVVGENELMRLSFAARPRVVMVGGGLPVRLGPGEWLGGIGVSGASAAEDEECARVGLAALGAPLTEQ